MATAFRWSPTGSADSLVAYLEARRAPAPVLPCSVSPVGSGGSPGSSLPATRPDQPGRAGSATPHRAVLAAGARPQPALRHDPVAAERRCRILTVDQLIDDINEWAGPGARPQLIFARDLARFPAPCRATCRPTPTGDCPRAARLTGPLRADALLLPRATGMRIGELVDLELDCVRGVPGAGPGSRFRSASSTPSGWSRSTRRPSTSLTASSPTARRVGRSAPAHRQTVEFLLTHQGRRISVDTLATTHPRHHRSRTEIRYPFTNLGRLTPPPWSTPGVAPGADGHAGRRLGGNEPSLRPALRQTVRTDATRAHPGQIPYRASAPAADPTDHRRHSGGSNDWKEAPTIKARLAGGNCLRTQAQGACAYADISERCPDFPHPVDSPLHPHRPARRCSQLSLSMLSAAGSDDDGTSHRRLVEHLRAG